MFDTKFWEEIKTNSPKAYDECRKYFNISNNYMNDWLCICYDDLETYFDGLGIEIFIEKYINDKDNIYYLFQIHLNNMWQYSWPFRLQYKSDSRPEAKLEAVKKAFMIYEDQLKGVK